jgi:hypothetical protein
LGVALQLFPNPQSLSAIIHKRLFEPRMLESLLGGDPVFGVVNENVLQKIQK